MAHHGQVRFQAGEGANDLAQFGRESTAVGVGNGFYETVPEPGSSNLFYEFDRGPGASLPTADQNFQSQPLASTDSPRECFLNQAFYELPGPVLSESLRFK